MASKISSNRSPPETRMNTKDQRRALRCAIEAAKTAGSLMRKNQFSVKKVDSSTQHDIKLALDVRSQKVIEKKLHEGFPGIALLGEEHISGDPKAPQRWVVDPIDGTVNFTYGIPHACVSIALQEEAEKGRADYEDGYNTLLGVVYDPFCDELWTALRGETARLNNRPIQVSKRRKLKEAIVSIGFAKTHENLEATLPYFLELVHSVRKIRIMGSAALSLTYVASGRFDAYIERGIRLWDIAAGGLILECAGGRFSHDAIEEDYAYRMISSNRVLHKKLRIPE
jgi:myo-inositol-1(or 4)-monophosphatase